ncbi:MAG: hypothetical protein H6740_08180 [Alphaproteobacteria bacterium]|nr:hypothetical protein [Alphaproteobacteria bacterium]
MTEDRRLDVDALVRDLEVPGPELGPPPWPQPGLLDRLRAALRHPGVLLAGAALVAALALLALRPPSLPEQGPSLRGVDAQQLPEPFLDLVLEADGQARRLARGEAVDVGDRVFFRVSASRAHALTLSVAGPTGREVLAHTTAGPTPVDLGGPRGLHAWRFDAPGRYAFSLSTTPEGCPRPGCTTLIVEVR